MKDHYGFTDRQMKKLARKGIGIKELYKLTDDFNAKEAPLSKINLYHYVDNHGDFTEPRKPSDFVAMEIFNTLTIKEQIALGEYMEFLETGK